MSVAYNNTGTALSFFKTFEEFVTEKDILFYLCRMRAKLAKQRNKKHLVYLLASNPQHDCRKAGPSGLRSELEAILPPRKKWLKLGRKSRHKNDQPLDSINKNIKSLLLTVEVFRKSSRTEPFVPRLEEFIIGVKDAISDKNYNIRTPDTIPMLKDGDKEPPECRPISMFGLKDRIVIGLANKFLTRLFDRYFYDNSIAFRASRVVGDRKMSLTHHDAVKRIKAYLEQQKGKKLWVAECDMRKFYDTVNHGIIKRSFKVFLKKAKKDHPELQTDSIERIFGSYLASYAFNKNVLPLNKDADYFKNHKLARGQFGWVQDELIETGYYKSINRARIGIPQGGALSGLIANIVLDQADGKIKKLDDGNLLYIRYCDDMIIMHPDRRKCSEAFNVYREALRSLKLIPHNCGEVCGGKLDFWTMKSKLPYKWGKEKANGSQWIGFVGYEIHYDGHVRIRKNSLKKEMEKQYEVVNEIRRAVKWGNQRATNKTIEESVINRLIGMSVGRVKLWNADSLKNEMCWINGFNEITDNKYVVSQLKRLDASRNKLFRKLSKELRNNGNIEQPASKARKKRQQGIYYGKPFSYYYQGIERKRVSFQLAEREQTQKATP
ncbi:MAG: reverse transcriptase domain-containing protein [Deltaproteobacteria bacterium]|nr:reverse transcriptase domain-containing protein [Deltaproteobacteria bacterium]